MSSLPSKDVGVRNALVRPRNLAPAPPTAGISSKSRLVKASLTIGGLLSVAWSAGLMWLFGEMLGFW